MQTAEPGAHVCSPHFLHGGWRAGSRKDPEQSRLSGGRGLSSWLALRVLAPGRGRAGLSREPREEVHCLEGLLLCWDSPPLVMQAASPDGLALRWNSGWENSEAGRPGHPSPPPVRGRVDTACGRALTGSEVAGRQSRGDPPPGLPRGAAGHPRALPAPNPPNVIVHQTCVSTDDNVSAHQVSQK